MKTNLEDLNQSIINCRACPRLVSWREEVAVVKRRAFLDWEYWGKPVPGFGDINGEILVVGLAPGAHGSNRTGRMFTGDASGEFLYPALYRAGFANQPQSEKLGDSLTLNNLFITAVCRCVPPQNKPTVEEIKTCVPYLLNEISLMKNLKGIVALGQLAFNEIKKIYQGQPQIKTWKFAHNKVFKVEKENLWVLTSYHPSRQNTQTGKLTEEMFDQIWQQANRLAAD